MLAKHMELTTIQVKLDDIDIINLKKCVLRTKLKVRLLARMKKNNFLKTCLEIYIEIDIAVLIKNSILKSAYS